MDAQAFREKLGEIEIGSIRIGREQLQTDAHDFVIENPLLIEYANSLSSEWYTINELLADLERSEFFRTKTNGMTNIQRIKRAETIRMFIQDCAEITLRTAHFNMEVIDGNSIRAIQDYVQEGIQTTVLKLINERAGDFPPAVPMEKITLTVARFAAQVKRLMQERTETAKKSLEEVMANPRLKMLVAPQEAVVQKRGQEGESLDSVMKAVMASLGDGAKLDVQSLMEHAKSEIEQRYPDQSAALLVLLSHFLADTVAREVLRHEPGYQLGHNLESDILLREYQASYGAHLLRIAKIEPERDED